MRRSQENPESGRLFQVENKQVQRPRDTNVLGIISTERVVGRNEQEKSSRKEGEAVAGPTPCRAFKAMLGLRISLGGKAMLLCHHPGQGSL